MSKEKDMAKSDKADKVVAPSEPMPQVGCGVCGSNDGSFEQVTPNVRMHPACAASRPDLVNKAKARA